MNYKVIPLFQELPYEMKEDLYEASYKIKRGKREIIVFETGQTPQKAIRKLINLLTCYDKTRRSFRELK
jgi:HEPN domain-containing protein